MTGEQTKLRGGIATKLFAELINANIIVLGRVHSEKVLPIISSSLDEYAEATAGRERFAEGRDHLTVSGTFQSDKYSWCPPGFVPLKISDPAARDLLAEYAKRREAIDVEFPRDLLEALENTPEKPNPNYKPFARIDDAEGPRKKMLFCPRERILFAWDGEHWFVRHIEMLQHDLGQDRLVYYCDHPIANDLETVGDAVDAAMQAEAEGEEKR